MTHRQVRNDRATQISASFPQNLLQAEAVSGITAFSIVAITESTESKASEILEHSGETPVSEHAIQAVGSFSNVFEHQNRSAQIGEVSAAQEV